VAFEAGIRTRYREALQVALAAHFASVELPIEFQAGEITGRQELDVGCVWFDNKTPHKADWNNEESFFGVRVLRHFAQDQGGAEPRASQNERLEWTFEQLEDGLVAVVNKPDLVAAAPEVDPAGWPDYFIVTLVAINHLEHHVTASLAAQLRNRTRRGG
jgi:hypothetical protein